MVVKTKKILYSQIKPWTNSNLAQSNHRVQIKPTCQIGFKPYKSGGNSVNRNSTVDYTKSDQLESHITILNGKKQIYLRTPIYFRRPKKWPYKIVLIRQSYKPDETESNLTLHLVILSELDK